jgi:hypothetical protein
MRRRDLLAGMFATAALATQTSAQSQAVQHLLRYKRPATTGGTWTPAQFGADLMAWLNPRDAGSLTLNGSNEVTAWASRNSSLGVDWSLSLATGTGVLLGNGIGGTQTLQFTGGCAYTGTIVNTIAANADMFAAFVAKPADNTTRKIFEMGNIAAGAMRTFGSRSGFIDFGNNGVDHTLSSGPSFDNVARCIAHLSNSSGSNAYIDGSNTPFTNGLDMGNSDSGFILGAHVLGTYNEKFSGSVGEIVVVDRDLTTDERHKLVSYLMWNAGLQAQISGDNPYAGAAP